MHTRRDMIESFGSARWEYHVEIIHLDSDETSSISKGRIEERLNHLGDQGWELVNISERRPEYGQVYLEYTLKRPRQG